MPSVRRSPFRRFSSPCGSTAWCWSTAGRSTPCPSTASCANPAICWWPVDVSAPFSGQSRSLNYYHLLTFSSEIMMQHIAQLMCRIYPPDMLIEIPSDRFGIFEFYRAAEILESGRELMEQVLMRPLVAAEA